MKKIIIAVLALAAVATEASAFNLYGHQTVAALADMYLTDGARKKVERILDSDMVAASGWLMEMRKHPDYPHTKLWGKTRLNEEGKSTTMDENDGVVQIEKAIAVLRNRKNESDSLVLASLRTLIHLVGDVHCLSHITIDGNDNTKGFVFYHWNELTDKRRKDWKSQWYNTWERAYFGRYSIFSVQYYAKDIDIFARENRAEYEKGTPRFWVENGGEDVVRALADFQPEATVPTQVFQLYEYLHTKCMAKAGYRLAALLNDIFK